MPTAILQHRFVDGFPDRLQPGVLYVSIEFASMSHLCCCGCGCEVITPLSPRDWKFTYDGASVSVHPSIGNWSLPCRSHYIIQSGRINWAGDWTEAQIEAARKCDLVAKRGHAATRTASPNLRDDVVDPPQKSLNFFARLWQKIFR